jgi:hypothetical protein
MAQQAEPAAPPPPSLGERLKAAFLSRDGVRADRVVIVSSTALFVLMAMNFTSGGMIAAIFGLGSTSVPATSLATFAAGEVTYHGTVWGLGPATVLSVGQPVDAALRDGYTTPSSLAAAFAESGRRAEGLAVRAGTYLSGTVQSWWNGF